MKSAAIYAITLAGCFINLANCWATTSLETMITSRSALNIESDAPDDVQLFEVSMLPTLSWEVNDNFKLTAIARLRAQTQDGLKATEVDTANYSNLSEPLLLGNTAELELRELFFEGELGSGYLTAGKQQIVWGKADGLKVLDVVNPQSFREFILEPFEDSRIPQWSLNYEFALNESQELQLVWVLDQSTHALPEGAATYRFTSPRLIPQAPSEVRVDLFEVDIPSQLIGDSDIGLRWIAFMGGWDLTLNYLYQFNDFPVLFQSVGQSIDGITTIEIKPGYERTHIIGGTFSNSFGDFTLRGELGYITDRYFLGNLETDNRGVSQHDELSYVLGVDWYGVENGLLSVQLFQSHLMDYKSSVVRPEVDTVVTFLAKKDFLNETLSAEILALINLDDNDELFRSQISYQWSDDIKVWLDFDIFTGNEAGLFGQYNNNDRVLMGIEYGF